MFVHRVETPGLVHWSYYVEDGGEAIVVDPRLDVDVYVDLARTRGDRIVSAVETHRNEDLVTGAWNLPHALVLRSTTPTGTRSQLRHRVEDGDVVPFGSATSKRSTRPGIRPDTCAT
jgi:hydroxyacylglutathione hydrolase